MTTKVLVVDDSGFFRRRVSEILNSDRDIKVIGTAENGLEAVQKVLQLRPDVVTMDVEMPVLDGISAVRRIMSSRPTPIIMFSSLTFDGAEATLDALDAGALDFLPKKFEDISSNSIEARRHLCRKVKLLAKQEVKKPALREKKSEPERAKPKSKSFFTRRIFEKSESDRRETSADKPRETKRVKVSAGSVKFVCIGTSTGGPAALQKVLSVIPENFMLPIVLIQHMPSTFTQAFAQRLNQLCAINVKEAEDGDELKPGWAFLAPGGQQLEFKNRSGNVRLSLRPGTNAESYKPSVDVTFMSAAKELRENILAIVMTGMGADGREGAKELKKNTNNLVWAQNEESCIVFGMPMSVIEAGVADNILDLSEIGPNIAKL